MFTTNKILDCNNFVIKPDKFYNSCVGYSFDIIIHCNFYRLIFKIYLLIKFFSNINDMIKKEEEILIR